MQGAVTFGSTDKPAEMSALKFPGRAFLFTVAKLFFPAGSEFVFSAALIDQQKIELSLDMGRNRPPPLFVTVDSLKRHSQEFS